MTGRVASAREAKIETGLDVAAVEKLVTARQTRITVFCRTSRCRGCQHPGFGGAPTIALHHELADHDGR